MDIPNDDAIFHTVYDLDERYQVPGMQFTQTHSICEKCPPMAARAAAGRRTGAASTTISGRLIAAICHNMDLGDSWENADEPTYPQKFSALGIRIGVNYIVYAMSH